MACYYPLTAFQNTAGDIVFTERGDIKRELKLPCGKCIGCRLEKSRQWAMRCMHEAQMHEYNSFVTLTYDDDHLPDDYSLNYRHFVLFAKRLRKSHGKFRFYMCGEYGEKFSRPHYHACIFGLFFNDRYPWGRSGEHPIYRSKSLEDVWTKGNCYIGDVTFESAAYVARYITKKVTGDAADKHYQIVDPETGEIHRRTPEFSRMSNRPGIGASWFAKYKSEVFPLDRVVVRGKDMIPPRYYKVLLDREPGQMSDWIEHQRALKSRERGGEHDTEDRLRVREKVALARLKSMNRSFE